jgi:hypothetical protein
MKNVKGLCTGETDIKGNKIYYETSKLKLPNGTIARLMFDYGQLAAYYARWEDKSYIVGFDGVNNHKSFYLRDCEVL